jgi:hypothetical protein
MNTRSAAAALPTLHDTSTTPKKKPTKPPKKMPSKKTAAQKKAIKASQRVIKASSAHQAAVKAAYHPPQLLVRPILFHVKTAPMKMTTALTSNLAPIHPTQNPIQTMKTMIIPLKTVKTQLNKLR